MPKLHIPPLGTELILAASWNFKLFNEHRNSALIDASGLKLPHRIRADFWQLPKPEQARLCTQTGWLMPDGSAPASHYDHDGICHDFTIIKGALLSIDRIFIRKGGADYNSVSFWLKASKIPLVMRGVVYKRSMRFWAKLDDVNRIEFAA